MRHRAVSGMFFLPQNALLANKIYHSYWPVRIGDFRILSEIPNPYLQQSTPVCNVQPVLHVIKVKDENLYCFI